MDYYSVLGLEKGAAQNQIKRAYFSMVRQYSPEENPEKFREIREAYEYLLKSDAKEGPVFPEMKDPLAVKMLKHIEKIREGRDTFLLRDACEEARRLFPNEPQFLYLLAIAQREAGNTGKAVKNCELLVKQEPENKWFRRELAISYMERGYTQKAFPAFEKAYEMGCRDNDFVMSFAMECEDYGQYDTGAELLFGIVRQKKRWNREQIPELLDAYSGLISISSQAKRNYFTETLDSLHGFVQTYSVYLEENLYLLCNILAMYFYFREYEEKESDAVRGILSALEKSCRSSESREILDELRNTYLFSRMDHDAHLGETLRRNAEAVYDEELNATLKKYAILDTQLCMIEEREEILPQLAWVRQEYPAYYEKIRQFAENLATGKNLEYLKSTLLEQYIRLSKQVTGGFYFEQYPQEERRAFGTVMNQETIDEPYVRSGKKIGRNEPCPCGSGKKYKHCCGRR